MDELDVGNTGRRGKRYWGRFLDSWLEQLGMAVQVEHIREFREGAGSKGGFWNGDDRYTVEHISNEMKRWWKNWRNSVESHVQIDDTQSLSIGYYLKWKWKFKHNCKATISKTFIQYFIIFPQFFIMESFTPNLG